MPLEGFTQWEMSDKSSAIAVIVAAAVLLICVLFVHQGLGRATEEAPRKHRLGWTYASGILALAVMAGFDVLFARATTYPEWLPWANVWVGLAAQILLVVLSVGTVLGFVTGRRGPDGRVTQEAKHLSWFGLGLLWTASAVIVVVAWLSPVAGWLNVFFGTTLSVPLWAILFAGCAGTVVIVWFGILVFTRPSHSAGPRAGHLAIRQGGARMRVLALGVAYVLLCTGLFAVVYQAREKHSDDLVTQLTERFQQGVGFLESDDAGTRIAGVDLLASVADDYALHPELNSSRTGRDQAIDTIVTYLKKPFDPTTPAASTDKDSAAVDDESTVRLAISRLLHDHLDASQYGPCDVPENMDHADDVDLKGRVGKGVPSIPIPSTSPSSVVPPDEVLNPGAPQPLSPRSASDSGPMCWDDHSFDFSGAHFLQADFADAYFGKDAVFSSVSFFGTTNFTRAVFEQGARFDGAQFVKYGGSGSAASGWASFNEAVFSGEADFSDTVFDSNRTGNQTPDDHWDVSFLGTDFNGDLSFRAAEIDGAVTFDQSEFSHNCYVDAGTKQISQRAYDRLCDPDHPEWDNADFTDAQFATACGELCRLGVDVEFTNTVFYSSAVFSGVQSKAMPEFWSAKFYGDTWLDIAPATPNGTYAWCVPLTDDDLSADTGCIPTASGSPWPTIVTLGPDVTVYLDHQSGFTGQCTLGNTDSDRLRNMDLVC